MWRKVHGIQGVHPLASEIIKARTEMHCTFSFAANQMFGL